MIEIKLAVMLVCAALFWLGGFAWLPARRFIMPSILALCFLWVCRNPWDLFSLSVIGIYCLGYGVKSPLRHSLGNGWGRGVWGLLAGLCISLPLFLTGNLYIFFLIPYLALNFTLENALKNIPETIGDPMIGLGFSCIILLIH